MNTTNTMTEQSAGDGSSAFTAGEAAYYCFAVAILVLFCFCTRSRIPDSRFVAAAAERRRQWEQSQDRKDRMNDKDYRAALVLKGLVFKKITEEKDGFLTLGDCKNDGDDDENSCQDERSAGGSRSIDSMDEKTSTCAICLEQFRVHDIVGLSRTLFQEPFEGATVCNHVFHKDCIVAWLMKPMRDECPSCRTVIVQENEQDRSRTEPRTDEESASNHSNSCEIPEYHSNSVLVIMHGLVSRMRQVSYSLIGQSIHTKLYEDDVESAQTCPETPPSPFRRVFSLESTTRPRHRSTALRRRTSVGSMTEEDSPETTASNIVMLPDVLDEVESQSSPALFRRVVSDFGVTQRTASTTIASLGTTSRALPLSFRPRTLNRMALYDHTSERSMEDDIVIREVSSSAKLIGEDVRNDILL